MVCLSGSMGVCGMKVYAVVRFRILRCGPHDLISDSVHKVEVIIYYNRTWILGYLFDVFLYWLADIERLKILYTFACSAIALLRCLICEGESVMPNLERNSIALCLTPFDSR